MLSAVKNRKGIIALALIVILSFGMVLSAGALAPGNYTASLSIDNPYAPRHEFDFFSGDASGNAVVTAGPTAGKVTITIQVKDPVNVKVYPKDESGEEYEAYNEDGTVTGATLVSGADSVNYSAGTLTIVVPADVELANLAVRITFGVDIISTDTHGDYTATLRLS
jgi:hypothetical protein